ncbi:MAG TPA: DNA-directed RNA polymerase subunit alpha [Kiritimatiellia bacterium]|nr:DNA-directed RNA polymerase subunit alpha [Kiritimatiellia bacterium]HPS09102.1 DNA-directed RNA polymerase subunit alpha [Kiritimatiellia bacterium]
MPIRLSRFEMPRRVQKEENTATATYSRFIAEPFEVGYARTVGNSLRRVLLSSIEGVAITSIRISGANHEFCALPGVSEDVTDIILNLKRVLLKSFSRNPVWLKLNKKGPCVVTAADFAEENSIEVLNPTQHIATLDVDGTLAMEAEIRTGRGFCPAEGNKTDEQEIGRIPIDSIFSPVSRVNFLVENTRVGQRTDYEKLILDVWTDGRVSPDEAVKTAAAVLRHHLDVFVDYSEEVLEFEESEKKVDEERDRLRRILNMSVNEIELSVRAANCLNNANITTIGELAMKTEADMLKYRNFGKKSLNEIKDKLTELGLYLGYKFDPDLLEGNK